MRPLTLTAEMALAAILGSKTETRRPLRPQPDEDGLSKLVNGPWQDTSGRTYPMPFGDPGTELWLREPGYVLEYATDGENRRITVKYASDGGAKSVPFPERLRGRFNGLPRWAWRLQGIPNGIFREAARFKTVVLEVRVERLQAITLEGLKLEGGKWNGETWSFGAKPDADILCAYMNVWDRIYGSRPGLAWADNPWVSVTKFKKLEAPNA